MQPSPDAALLNDHQRRHLGVTLGQIQRLLHQIGALLTAPPSPSGLVTETADLPAEFIRQAPEVLTALDAAITALAERFDLPRRERSRYRWVRAVLGSSIDNLEDTRAAALRPYGEVHPALTRALDPALRELQSRLRALLTLLESEGQSE